MKSPHLILALALLFALAPAAVTAADAPAPKKSAAKKVAEPALVWHDVTTWGVEGRAWPDEARKTWFDRLPAVAEKTVTPAVWGLSLDTAGMLVRFKTNASTIWADYTLRRERLAGANMTAIGASGIDLYARDEKGNWRWAGDTRPDAKVVRQAIVSDLAPGEREYMAYLPLYNGLEKLSLGVPPDAHFETIAPRTEKPIVFYGTSITHGASASRPGMTHPAILGRRLNLPVVNLGFSGNGRMDAAVGECLTRLDAAVYVIDCLPNMSPESVRQKCIPLVHQLRAARPNTPIVLVEDRRNTNAWIQPKRDAFHTANHEALKECYTKLQQEGVKELYYVPGDDLLGHDAEASTDGSHPSDLGFVRQADIFEPVLRAALHR